MGANLVRSKGASYIVEQIDIGTNKIDISSTHKLESEHSSFQN